MKQKISMKIGTKRFIITLVILLSLTGYYWFTELKTPVLNVGTSVTTIAGTDKLSDSRSVINDNFASLNAGKMEYGTTTIPTLTTASALVTVGALSSGSLTTGFTTINVAQGGTGRATLNVNQVLLGNGVSGIDKVSGLGDSGQFLTSNGAGTPPTWQTSAVDTGINYNWTGEHTFTASSSMLSLNVTDLIATTATSTNIFNTNFTSTGTQTLNGIAYTFPATDNASSTVLMTDGSGGLSWNFPIIGATASDTLQGSADIERTITGTSNLTLKKNIISNIGGTIRLTYEIKQGSGGTASTEIRDQFGNVLASASTSGVNSYEAQSHDIKIFPNTELKGYLSTSDTGNTAYIQNFRLKFTVGALSNGSVLTN